MTMKKIYEKPFMKEHKLLQTNNLLLDTSKLNDGDPDEEIHGDDELDEVF